MFTFAHPATGETRVPRMFLNRIGLFQERPDLAAKGRYTITSDVGREAVDLFFARLLGDDSAVATAETAEQLQALSNELGFAGFEDEIRALLGGDFKVQKDLMGLRGRVDKHDAIIEELRRRVLELEQQLRAQRVLQRVEAVERRVEEVRNDVEGAVAEARREAGALREDVERLRSEVGKKASAEDVAAPSKQVPHVASLSKQVARLKKAEAKKAESKRAAKEATDLTSMRIYVGKAQILVSDKSYPLDTYVMFKIQDKKFKSKIVQNSNDPIYDDYVVVKSPNPDTDVLVIKVKHKEVARDEDVCDKVKIPVRVFRQSDRHRVDLKKDNRNIGTLYLEYAGLSHW